MDALPLVEVEWLDSVSWAGWRTEVKELVPCVVRTIGFVVDETETHLTISSHYNDYGHWADPMAIPKGAISAVYELTVEE